MRVLGKKSVAGVDRLDVGYLSGADDPRNVQVALGWRGRADANGIVSVFKIAGLRILFGEDRDALDAQFPAGPDNPERYLASICDKYS